jgi:hypothetical protein
MRHYQCALVAGLVLAIAVNSSRADEKKIEPDRLPMAVANAIKSKFSGAQILSAEVEQANGQTRYEVAIKHNNHNVEVTLNADGTIVATAKDINANELPKPVYEAVASRHRGYNASRIREIEENGKTSFAVQFPSDRERMTVLFDGAGLPIEKPAGRVGHQMTIQIGDQVICRADYSTASEGMRLVRFASLNQEIRPAGASAFDQAGATRIFDQFLVSARAAGQSVLIPFNEADVLAMMRLLNPAVSPDLDVWGNWTRQAAINILLWELDQSRASAWQAAWYDLAGRDLIWKTQFAKDLTALGRDALKPGDEKKR